MAELHERFERIHPFLDGNGRTGRRQRALQAELHGLARELEAFAQRLERHIMRPIGVDATINVLRFVDNPG